MAIRVSRNSVQPCTEDLRIATPYQKGRNYNTAVATAPFATDIIGHWRAMWFRGGYTIGAGATSPSVAINGLPVLCGFDNGTAGSFASTVDTALRIGAQGFSTVNMRRQLRSVWASTAQAWATGEGDADSTRITSPVPVIDETPMLLIDGIINTGDNTTPAWRNFVAVCPLGGTPITYVGATATNATYITNLTGRLFHQVFVKQGTTNRTIGGMTLEHIALVTGDFPWDTVNLRPHHDAIAALAASGGNPFLRYDTLVAAQNASTLPYANLRTLNGGQGKGRIDMWFTLADFSAGLTNLGGVSGNLSRDAAANNFTPLEEVATIAPPHWQTGTLRPTIDLKDVRFTGGAGTRNTLRSGTYDVVNTTSLQRRWEYATGAVNSGAVVGDPVPGFDWATTGLSLVAGAWTSTDALPIGGPYKLRIRDTSTPSLEAQPLDDNLVGTVMFLYGQSGASLAFRTGFAGTWPETGNNILNVPLSSTASGMAFRMLRNEAGGSTYARPEPGGVVLRPSTTPGSGTAYPVGQGFITCANRWAEANPRHPLAMVVPAVNGVNMTSWTANDLVLTSATWRYLGAKTVPGISGVGTSGLMGYYALLFDSYADIHAMMWTGIATTGAARLAFVSAIDGLFTNAPNSVWLGLPPWRARAAGGDTVQMATTRVYTVDFIRTDLPSARGALTQYAPDITADNTPLSLHPSFNSAWAAESATNPVPDTNWTGSAKIGAHIGYAAAFVSNRKTKANGPRIVRAWTDDAHATVNIELGRQVRTLNGAAIANLFQASTGNGTDGTWGATGAGFTVALDSTATRAILTPDAPTKAAWQAAGANLRVDYARDWPFPQAVLAAEADATTNFAEQALWGMLYDNMTHRGNVNLAQPAGNPLASASLFATGEAGVRVEVFASPAARTAKLLTTERFTGTRNVTVTMYDSGGTPLKTKVVTITAS